MTKISTKKYEDWKRNRPYCIEPDPDEEGRYIVKNRNYCPLAYLHASRDEVDLFHRSGYARHCATVWLYSDKNHPLASAANRREYESVERKLLGTNLSSAPLFQRKWGRSSERGRRTTEWLPWSIIIKDDR